MNSVSPNFGDSQPEILPPQFSAIETKDPLARAFGLPCTLVLEVPAVAFTVGTLMALSVGSIVETASQQNEDLALHVNGQLLGMVEFEVVGDRLAMRLTGMA
jgi:flagellar motor switch/type III secretory pathway protein FliN